MPAPLIEIGHLQAVIAGFSAIRLPFAKGEIVFHDPNEGTALLMNVVEPGATLWVSFPNHNTEALTTTGKAE